MYYFIKKLKSIHPDFIITQPTFGYPKVIILNIKENFQNLQIAANNFIINNSWDVDGNYKDVTDTVGIMAYGEETGDEIEVREESDQSYDSQYGFQSLTYVKNYAEATSQWNGFPIWVFYQFMYNVIN